MIDVNKNQEINQKLSEIYEKYSKAHIDAYVKAFNDTDPPCRMNEFGIIDIEKFDSDNAILFISKEKNGWSNEEFNNNIFFRNWLHNISKDGVAGKGHVQKHPTMWYNIGRWAMFLNNPELDPEYIRWCKLEALNAIGTIAFTNINKVRGRNNSKNEYYTLAYTYNVGEILKEELAIIKPKIIVCCGTYDEFIYHAPEYKSIAIKMPHPTARKSCIKMLSILSDHISK